MDKHPCWLRRNRQGRSNVLVFDRCRVRLDRIIDTTGKDTLHLVSRIVQAASMSNRYFVDSPIAGHSVMLVGTEAHHLAHVMRSRVGDFIVLFDGSGWEFTAQVQRLGKQGVELAILTRERIDRELPQEVHLAVALPKGDRQAWLVEKAVELGVASLIPLITERSVAQPVEKALARLRRGVIEASKQCGRNRLMKIDGPLTWEELMRRNSSDALRWVAHPGGQPAGSLLRTLATSPGQSNCACLAIGPEGGLTDLEIHQGVSAGWQLVDLGPRILRVETAAVLLTALLAASQGAA
jgi:16S rRNA (uracil1498-N3)-methyltransferase